MKLTRHNGRAGKNGAYNPKHNDRRFDVANSEHIDVERTRQNIYWDCYTGLSSALTRERGGENDYSFEKIERIYYYEHYADHVQAQNERNIPFPSLANWANAINKSSPFGTNLPDSYLSLP